MPSPWSKSFSRNPEKIFRAEDVQLLVKLTFIGKIEILFFTCTWFSFRPQTFNSYNQDVVVKLRRIAVLVVIVVVILFRCHTSAKFQEAISWSRTWTFFLHCLSLKYVVSDHFRWGNVPCQLIKINWERVFILIKFAHGTDVWNYLSSACTSMWGIWILFHPAVKQWLKSVLRDHWLFTTVQSLSVLLG